MRTVLVDTDILINFLRGREKARQFLFSLIDDAAISCSAITIAEIFAGMRASEVQKTRDLMDNLDVIPVTREIAEQAGRYKGSIKSHSLELDDCIIAASAFVGKAILATGNGRHYPMEDIKKVVVSCD